MCGLRDRVNRKRLATLCSVHGILFLGIQESRVTQVDIFELRSMWVNFSFDFCCVECEGAFGWFDFFMGSGCVCEKQDHVL